MKVLVVILLLNGCAFDPMGLEYHETQQNKALRLRNQEAVQAYWNQEIMKKQPTSSTLHIAPLGEVYRLNLEANKALYKLANALKGSQNYYEVNKLIRRLWDLNLSEQ